MDDVEFWGGEEEQCGAELLGELASETERNAAEVSIPQQIVEVVREQVEYETQMMTEHEMTAETNYSEQ